MNEIKVYVKKQEDGWYLASTKNGLKKGGFVTEAQDYETLKEKIREATEFHLRDGYYKELGLPESPQVRLIYSELLFENPEAERILIIGNTENGVYRARTNRHLNVDLSHQDLDTLKGQISQEIQEQGHHDKHIEFRLEEVL